MEQSTAALDSEQEPFLSEKPSVRDVDRRDDTQPCVATSRKMWLVHLVLISIYTSIFLWFSRHTLGLQSKMSTGARQMIDFMDMQPQFNGPKRPETDEAWANLLSGVNVRVTEQDLIQQNISSVALPEGGFLVWRESMHQLHCVKRLREWVRRDEYHPDLSAEEESSWLVHVNHCIEILRRSVMCNADSALVGFHWQDGKDKPEMNLRSAHHSCVDWDSYTSQMRTQSVSRSEMSRVRKSLLGSS